MRAYDYGLLADVRNSGQVHSARDTIQNHLDEIRERMAGAARRSGREPEDVRLVAVTKTVGIEEIRRLLELGVRDLGENRVEQALEKIRVIGAGPVWHMIGNVQRRKVREVVDLFDRVDAVDRLSLAETLERRCSEAGKVMPVLLEVNVSGEAAKHGFAPEEVERALETMGAMKHLRVEGLMTMAPLEAEPEATRAVFAGLRELGERFGLRRLSMGMTNDFEVAIEEGATEVRIGSALFN